ncbi:MAG: hypothetical protein F6K58_32210 [Symploca sp. SIO2E9]|nr:hypothetical protein [Symploca sp. SIO2E9]
MAKKPRTPKKSTPTEKQVQELIEKGGSVTTETQKSEISAVTLRIDSQLLLEVDAAVKKRRVKIPRHTWIIEAIAEKLDRESNC